LPHHPALCATLSPGSLCDNSGAKTGDFMVLDNILVVFIIFCSIM
jgi:hypothetical protein